MVDPFVNVGNLLVDYIDFGGSYITKEHPWGKLDMEANATYVYNYAVKTLVCTFPPGSPKAGQPQFQVYTSDDQYRTGANINADPIGRFFYIWREEILG